MNKRVLQLMLCAGLVPLASCGNTGADQGSNTSETNTRLIAQSPDQRSNRTPTVSQNHGEVVFALNPGSMVIDTFWEIMKAPAAIHESEIQAQENALANELRKLSDEELIAFYLTYKQVMDKAYRLDLWAAAYHAGGGCSDDGFTCFRNWLIGRGKHAFFNALNEPDSLAIFDLDGEFHETMGCEWDLLPSYIWDEKHSSGPDFYDQLPDQPRAPMDPEGEEFDFDDHEDMCMRYPKISSVYYP